MAYARGTSNRGAAAEAKVSHVTVIKYFKIYRAGRHCPACECDPPQGKIHRARLDRLMEPSKAYPPVWDKPVIEAPPPLPLIPLPPAEVFVPTPPPMGAFAPRRRAEPPLVLPDFKQFAQSAPGFDAHMRDVLRDAQDMADAIAGLNSLIEET